MNRIMNAACARLDSAHSVPRGQAEPAKREALKVGKTVPEMLKADLDVEYKVDAELKKAIVACEKAHDFVTDMLKVQLEDTEMDHAYFRKNNCA
ncbi:hypothetical protein MASR1M42_17900 [Azonexus hydrophilus]